MKKVGSCHEWRREVILNRGFGKVFQPFPHPDFAPLTLFLSSHLLNHLHQHCTQAQDRPSKGSAEPHMNGPQAIPPCPRLEAGEEEGGRAVTRIGLPRAVSLPPTF